MKLIACFRNFANPPKNWLDHRGSEVDCIGNVMAHAQKPDLVLWRNGRVHLNWRWASVHSTTGSWGVRVSGCNAGYTMFWGSVKGTGYPLRSPVSPSLPLPCVTVCHHISSGVHKELIFQGHPWQDNSELLLTTCQNSTLLHAVGSKAYCYISDSFHLLRSHLQFHCSFVLNCRIFYQSFFNILPSVSKLWYIELCALVD